MDSSIALDASKYIALVKTLAKNGKVEGKFLSMILFIIGRVANVFFD